MTYISHSLVVYTKQALALASHSVYDWASPLTCDGLPLARTRYWTPFIKTLTIKKYNNKRKVPITR